MQKHHYNQEELQAFYDALYITYRTISDLDFTAAHLDESFFSWTNISHLLSKFYHTFRYDLSHTLWRFPSEALKDLWFYTAKELQQALTKFHEKTGWYHGRAILFARNNPVVRQELKNLLHEMRTIRAQLLYIPFYEIIKTHAPDMLELPYDHLCFPKPQINQQGQYTLQDLNTTPASSCNKERGS